MFIQIFVPYILRLIFVPIQSKISKKNAKNSTLQCEMNKNYIGGNFDYAEAYAFALNTIYVSLFFSSGMPIIIYFGAFSLLCQYWVNKYLCIQFLFPLLFNIIST